jgi:hypothetical protein
METSGSRVYVHGGIRALFAINFWSFINVPNIWDSKFSPLLALLARPNDNENYANTV